MNYPLELKGKVAVITGASQGFGKELARAFSSEGAQVVISSENRDMLAEASNELGVTSHPADVTSYEEVQALTDFTLKKYGAVDIWVNNAGIQIAPSPVEEVDRKRLKDLFDVNLFGYFYGCQAVLPVMKRQGSGLIINVNSTAGLEGKPDISAYVASKFAIKGLTQSLRAELVGTGIDVHGIHPGGMQTEIYREKYPTDFEQYMSVDHAIGKVMLNLMSDEPEQDLVIRRP